MLPCSLCCELFCFRCHGNSLLVLSCLHRIVIRTLPAVPVDSIHRISIISFFTVQPQSLYANLSSALVYTFYFRPWIQTVRCGSTVGTLQSSSAPSSSIPQKRVQSTTTFHNPHFKNCRVGDSYKITEQLFVSLI